MAQRTAFLNSDAKWFNKDFHHTWIENYMIKQPWVMFSDLSTKPEFALGNWQIAGGKAIIRCTRTTGTFAWEEILVSFESTTTENISTSWNKKVFIEIPEVYVNDSTAITDTLTQGVNLWVWRIVSDTDFPSHSNYIPLWEITGGDWQNATDLRPEVLRRGKPNTLSYFGWNWEEERIDIDNASLNKYLMSNGAWVAPSWEEWGWGGGWSWENFKRTFTADTDLLAKSMFWVEALPTINNINTTIQFWTTSVTKLFFTTILNWEDFDSVVLNLKAVNSPSDNLSVRIETLDANWKPSWTLVNVWAYGTVSPTSTATDTTINLSGTVTWMTAHTKVAVVISRSWTASDSNYYELWCLNDTTVIATINQYNGSVWSEGTISWCIDCDWFAGDAVVQATALNWVDWVWYCETWALAGNDFTWILQGTIDYSWAVVWYKYYLSDTGTLTDTGSIFIWKAIENDVLQLWSTVWWGQNTYDAIVDVNGNGDYESIWDAITDWKKSLFVMNGTYTMSSGTLSTWDFKMVGESRNWVIINVTFPTKSWTIFTLTSDTTSPANSFLFQDLTFNITYTGGYWYFGMFWWMWAWEWTLNIEYCNINVVQANNWCNFYITTWSTTNTSVKSSLINVNASWSYTAIWFLWIAGRGTCKNSVIIVDADQSIWTSWIEFWWNAQWTYIWCKFSIWKTHDTAWDIAMLWWTTWISCSYESSSNATQRLYWYQQNSSFSQTWTSLTYDSNLNTAVTSKKISIWKPSTSYTVWQYVMSWNSQTLARCKTAHTSWTTFDATKFDNVYGETYIVWNFHNCSFNVWWNVIIAWIATYYSSVVQPASMWNICNCQFSCYTSSSGQPNYCNIIILSNRGFNDNRILNQKSSVTIHLYLWWECSTFTWNRIMSPLWDVYAWWYGNVICNNIFTYITGWTAPTITQVSWWDNQIANNIIRWVADWTD